MASLKMCEREIERRITQLKVWRRGGERAPHKPLLLLLALGRAARGEPPELTFPHADRELGTLLREFGPPRSSVHTEYPFWRLQNDGLWEVTSDGPMLRRQGQTDPTRNELLRTHARAKLPDEISAFLAKDPAAIYRFVQQLLDANFPESLHDDLRAAIGLPSCGTSQPARDPRFRQMVLTAYEHRCAVCGFDVRLGTIQLGLDAAHIRWCQAGGPNTVSNGIALCVLHHKLFDRGCFTITDQHTLLLSEHLHGGAGFDLHLLTYHGCSVKLPSNPEAFPAQPFMAWHRQEIFRGPARYLPPRSAQLG